MMQPSRARLDKTMSTTQKILQPELRVRSMWWKPWADVHKLKPEIGFG
jgi:hypothetical protein